MSLASVGRVCLVLGLAVIPAAPARADSWTVLAVNDLSSSSSVSPINADTNAAGAQIPVGNTPLGIAITPDATRALVVGVAGSNVTPIDLTTTPPTALAPIGIPGHAGLNFIAISPSGTKAYVTDPAHGQVVPLDLTTSPPTAGAVIAAGTNPEGVAFTPDGSKAYVADNGGGTLIPIDAATDVPGTPIPVSPNPFGVAITPDGARAYVTDPGEGKVYPVALATGVVGSAITAGATVRDVAIAPDGAMAYVAVFGGATVLPISTATNTPGTPIAVGNGPFALALTPDGRRLYVANGGTATDNTVTPVDVTQSPPVPGAPITVGFTPRGIAITPDQAPVAAFTVSGGVPGAATAFDASASTTRFGTIASYAWDFGDGGHEVTGAPTTTHAYAAAGAYTATLTATSSGGSSLAQVFTGQTAHLNGGPSARTTRAVTITTAPAPAVRTDVTALAFGTVRRGTTSPSRVVTVTNAGNAALHVGAATLTGASPAEFALAGNSCASMTISPGAACAVAITFTPAGDGPRSAALAIADDASGSPHTIPLTGTGASTGTLTGTVRDGIAAAHPGVAATIVVACPPGEINSDRCIRTQTSGAGVYSLAGLALGEWGVEVFPPGQGQPGGKLWGASQTLAIVAGPQTHDFLLNGPQPLPSGMSVDTGAGVSTETPVIYPGQALTINVPISVDAEGPPGETLLNVALGGVFSDGGAGAPGTLLMGGAVMFAVSYDDNGDADGISQFVTGAITADGTGPVAAASCKDNPLLDNNIIRVSADGKGGVIINTPGLTTGSDFDGNVHVPGVHLQPIDVDGFLQGLGLNVPVDANHYLPTAVSNYNRAVSALETGYYSLRNGSNPLPQIIVKITGDKLQGKFHGPAKTAYKLADSLMKKSGLPGSGPDGPVKPCRKPPPEPKRKPTKPKPKPKPTGGSGSAYIDPSGFVRTTAGVPVAAARVVLSRADTKTSPLKRVPSGSAIMAPDNRANPDVTDSLGHFGWNTVPGFYTVSARRNGCRKTVTTKRLAVPPPRDNLRIVLACPNLRRVPTTTRLKVMRTGGYRLLEATVRRRNSRLRPGGVVVFRAGAKLLARVPVDRAGHAVFGATLKGTPRLRATYEGDGIFAPSHS